MLVNWNHISCAAVSYTSISLLIQDLVIWYQKGKSGVILDIEGSVWKTTKGNLWSKQVLCS